MIPCQAILDQLTFAKYDIGVFYDNDKYQPV